MILDRAITVDPGWHTAVTAWSENSICYHTQIDLKNINKWKDNPELTTDETKLTYMAKEFHKLLIRLPVEAVYIEGVELWKNSSKSLASGNKGYLSVLAYLVGMYSFSALTLGKQFYIIPPSTWKGQMNNDILRRRVARVCPELAGASEHILCAAGIGLHLQGVL